MKAFLSQFYVWPRMRPFGLFVVIYFGMALLQVLFLPLLNENYKSASLFLLVSLAVVAQAVVLIFIALLARKDFRCNALLKFKHSPFLKGVLVCAPMPLLEVILMRYAGPFPGRGATWALLRFQVPAVSLLVLTLFLCQAVLAPVLEEVAMRGFLQTSFMRYYGEASSIILTASCFSVMHWEMRNPGQAVYSFLLGILFSYWRVREKTLWTAIGGHIAFNAFAFMGGLLLCDLPKDVLVALATLASR